jgi:plastocyanin
MARPALLVLVLAAACGGGGGGGGGGTPTGPNPNPSTIVVEVRDFAFSPKSIEIEVGDSVTWRLVGADHTHTVTATGGAFDSGFVFTSGGATFTRTFGAGDADRTFNYQCQSHHASHMMQGSVRVGENAPPPDPGY